jgi:hypothetical protein
VELGKVTFWGTTLRRAVIGLLCVVGCFLCGCAKKDPTISRVEGSEPQRLSFGPPATVQQTFTEQMKSCWFNGPTALLSGYQYDTKPAVLETSDGLTELQQVTIYSGQGPQAPSFIIQFYPFNDNTLISTRNTSFPAELAARMKRDVETWIFGRAECQEPETAKGYGAIPSLSPQASSIVQHASTSGWKPQ